MAGIDKQDQLRIAAAPAAAAAFAVLAAIVLGSLMLDGSLARKTAPRGVADYFAPAGKPHADGSPRQGLADFFPPVDVSPASPPEDTRPGPASPDARRDQAPSAGLPGQAMEIVVKFKDESKVKDIIDTFWRNAPEAKAKFETFKRSHPAFADTSLARVTYSNELVLVHPGGAASPAQRLAKMREVAKKLKASPEVAYAEPDMIAQPADH